jgi:hypothetical protein
MEYRAWSSKCQQKEEKVLPKYSQGTKTPGMWSCTRRSRERCSPSSAASVTSSAELNTPPGPVPGLGCLGTLFRFQGCVAAASFAASRAPWSKSQTRGNALPCAEVSTSAP